MDSISATTSALAQREPARWVQAARRFLANRVATAALMVLVLIVLMSIFAPWIVPQNPYDLNAIDLADARRPPGHIKLSKQSQIALQLALDTSGSTATGLRVSRVEREDFAPFDAVAIGVESVADDPAGQRSWRLVVSPKILGPLDPIVSARISGLPRAASLSAGARPRFGDIWTLSAADLQGLRLTLPAEVKSVNLRLELTGGIERPLVRYWLGTDDQGRDLLSAIIMGLRISMVVAIISVLIALSLGTVLGLIAAYRGGRTDALIMRLVDLQVSFPTILVALILLALIGSGIGNVILALVIVQWALYARIARSAALAELGKEYVESARSLGFSGTRILLVHILPNCTPSLIVIATLEVAGAVSLEATLSFLGLGLPVTEPSLGLLVANGFNYLMSGYPWISVLPGLALLIAVLAINLVGDELRDILNPRLAR